MPDTLKILQTWYLCENNGNLANIINSIISISISSENKNAKIKGANKFNRPKC